MHAFMTYVSYVSMYEVGFSKNEETYLPLWLMYHRTMCHWLYIKRDSFKNEKTCLYETLRPVWVQKCVIEYLITKQRFISACII